MKREYKKPVLAVESFQLDAAIAASCSSQGFVPIGFGENTCGYPKDVNSYFNYHNCDTDVVANDNNSDPYDGVCYHGPGLAGMTFISS